MGGPTPGSLVTDGEAVHFLDEPGPWEDGRGLAEERVGGEGVCSGGAVGEEEADSDVVGGWVRGVGDGGVGDELEGHGGGVVDHAGEVLGDGRELGEAEEGEEGAVGAELDADLGFGFSGDG